MVNMTKFEERDGELFINGKKVLKGWESFTGWYWFATEKVEDDWNGSPLWYGFVQGHECEWGDFSEAELRQVRGRIWEIPQKALVYSGRRD